MAASPVWKVYNEKNEYIASCDTPLTAAMIVGGYGIEGMTIRFGHLRKHTLWVEGRDGQASESFDTVSETCKKRLPTLIEGLWKG